MQEVSDQLLELIAQRLRAMANPIRLKILHELEHGELSVGDLVASVGGSQANVSKQLTILRTADLVTSRRDGVSVFYRVSDAAVFSICRTVCDSLHSQASEEVETIERGRDEIFSRNV